MPSFKRKKINFDIIPGPNREVNFFLKFHHLVSFYNSSHILYLKEKETTRTEIQNIWGKREN